MASRRLLLLLPLLAGLGLAGGLGWYGWRRWTAPAPPEIALDQADPALAEAVEAARTQVRRDPYSVTPWAELGKLLRGAQLVPEAAACFAQAERLEPGNPRWPYLQGEALALRDPDAALPHLRRAAERADGTDADSAPLRLRLAEVLLDKGLNDEAEAHLRRALELEPDNPSVHYNLGVLALARDDLPAARDHLLHCWHSPFTRRKACVQLAALYRRLGQPNEAADFSRRADAAPADAHWIDPFLADLPARAVGKHARFKEVEHLETQGHFREAADLLTDLDRQGPDYRVKVALGKNLAKLGDYPGAERTFRAAIALGPDMVQAYYHLSRLLWVRAGQAGRNEADRAKAQALYREAAARARQALARKPDHAMAHMVLGLSLKELGQRSEALDALRTAAEFSPDQAEPHLHLGEALAEAGRDAEARAVLQRAVELASPDDPRPRAALAKLKKN